MSLIRVEVLEILETREDSVVVKAEYTSGHKVFSPLGFEYTFSNITPQKKDIIKKGYIFIEENEKNGKISAWPIGHKEKMDEFSDSLKELTRTANEKHAEEMSKLTEEEKLKRKEDSKTFWDMIKEKAYPLTRIR